MGSVARRTSHLTNRESPSATSLAEKIFNIEFQAQQQGVIAREVPKEVRDYWAPLGTGIRATDLLLLLENQPATPIRMTHLSSVPNNLSTDADNECNVSIAELYKFLSIFIRTILLLLNPSLLHLED